MKKRKLQVAATACLLASVCLGNSAQAVTIPFDVRPVLQPVEMKSSEGITPYGTYIASGTATITKLSNHSVRFSAETTCYRVAERVTADAYLQCLDGSWYTVDYVYGTGYDTSYTASYKDCAVESGHYYAASGGHSARANGVTETSTSSTGGIYIGSGSPPSK